MQNHTLFGLHLVGNDAVVDDFGFVMPKQSEVVVPSLTLPNGPVEGGPDIRPHEKMDAINCHTRDVPIGLQAAHPLDLTPSTQVGRLPFKPRRNPALEAVVSQTEDAVFSEEDLLLEQRWAREDGRVKTVVNNSCSEAEALQRDSKCCWICENWVAHPINFIESHTENEIIDSVFALFSIDGYTRATHLVRKEEVVSAASFNFAMKRASRFNAQASSLHDSSSRISSLSNMGGSLSSLSNLGNLGHFGSSLAMARSSVLGAGPSSLDSQHGGPPRRLSQRQSLLQFASSNGGRIIRWVGVRMLPPTQEATELIFVVNGRPRTTRDLPRRILKSPKKILLPILEEDVKGDASTQYKLSEINTVNQVFVGHEMRRIRNTGPAAGSMPFGLCVFEDPLNRGKQVVLPRKLHEGSSSTGVEWSFELSAFKDYIRDTPKAMTKCLDEDWAKSKLSQYLKQDDARSAVRTFLRNNYGRLIQEFRRLSFERFDSTRFPAGVTLKAFRDFVVESDPSLVDHSSFKLDDLDNMYCAACYIDKAALQEVGALPHRSLARFQFLEVLVRVACKRYISGSATGFACRQAVETIFNSLQVGLAQTEAREAFLDQVFTSHICAIFRDHMTTLRTVFDRHKACHCYPGRVTATLSYGAWLLICKEACDGDDEYEPTSYSKAFALAHEMRSDDGSPWKEMELTWSEFLVAIAALVQHSDEYVDEVYPDLLDDFLSHRLKDVCDALKGKPRRVNPHANLETMLAPVGEFLSKLFDGADFEGTGTLERSYLKSLLYRPQNVQSLRRCGFQGAEIEFVFRYLASRPTDSCTVFDVIDGFRSARNAAKLCERALVYLRKALGDIAKGNSQSSEMSKDDFLIWWGDDGHRSKFSSFGLGDLDFEDFTEAIRELEESTVSAEMAVLELLSLRDAQQEPTRAVRVLKKQFRNPDGDALALSSTIAIREALKIFGLDVVTEQLQARGMAIPEWTGLLAELDTEATGELPWETIESGLTLYWQLAVPKRERA
eukprot:TRINITY_DN40560_c0_g1_i1.p1 TRINITY_DN40560_c0_g1~~TRINITY_DN40560_c0_g1_i1.p1  ORF type:complete len:1007 (-),score=206.42 TRINITY_DN40560_c0_g1_i1:149-3169(-)